MKSWNRMSREPNEQGQDGAVVLYTTWPDAAAAQRCARSLPEPRLAACVNIGAETTSTYRWHCATETSRETVMLVKTATGLAQATPDVILANHPYETACVLAFTASSVGSSSAFLGWISAEVA